MLVHSQALITQLVFNHALRVRVKAETSTSPTASTASSAATSPDTSSNADDSESEESDSESEDDEPELDEFVVKLPNQLVAKGEEIFLRYGGHSNRMLFTEYGFVDDSVEPEVDVAELVDELVNRKFAGLTMKDLMPLDKHHFLSYVLPLLILS